VCGACDAILTTLQYRIIDRCASNGGSKQQDKALQNTSSSLGCLTAQQMLRAREPTSHA